MATLLHLLLPGLACIAISGGNLRAQDRLKTMPGYARYQQMSRATTNAFKSGALSVSWKEGGKAFEFQRNGKRFRYEIATKERKELVSGTNAPSRRNETDTRRDDSGRRARPSAPARGRQFTSATSPDGKWKALYRDRNLWLTETKGTNETAVTTDGNEKGRIKYGTASWVYGEELFQNTAMWWSTNSRFLAGRAASKSSDGLSVH